MGILPVVGSGYPCLLRVCQEVRPAGAGRRERVGKAQEARGGGAVLTHLPPLPASTPTPPPGSQTQPWKADSRMRLTAPHSGVA